MKKLILTLVLAIATTLAFSQDVNFGIKAGLNLSSQTGDPYGGNKVAPGISAGVIADVVLSNFSIQPGVLFTTKGQKISVGLVNTSDVPSGNYVTTTTLDYFEVPVNLLYHIAEGHGVKLYFGGGPYFAYGIGGTLSATQVGGSKESDPVNFRNEGNDNTVSYKNPDIGVNLLAGVIVNKRYSIDVGYGLGLTSIASGTGTIKNRVIHISLGYFFK